MRHANTRRGASWGAGLGLLGLLVVASILLILNGNLLTKSVPANVPGMNNAPTLFNAVDYAKSATQKAYDQQKNQLDEALNAASGKPASGGESNAPGR